MKRHPGQQGFTLLELMIGIGIAAMVLPVLASALWFQIYVPPKQNDKLAVIHDLDWTTLWLTRDANSAEDFVLGTSPQYGYLTWYDRTGSTTTTYRTTYYWDSGELLRELQIDSVVQYTMVIAKNVNAYGDLAFSWDTGQRYLTVDVTFTSWGPGAVEPTTLSRRITARLRPKSEPATSPPSDVPLPTPVPGSVTYYVATGPSLLKGTYVSGNTASLQVADGDFYVADSQREGGSVYVYWAVQGQSMPSPTTINSMEVRYTGKASSSGSAVELYVQNAADTVYNPTGVADSYVAQNAASTNYGSATSLYVRSYASGGTNYNQRSFLWFDLSGIPSGSYVKSATLRLHMFQAPAASRTYEAHRLVASWTETGGGSINWSNQPGVAALATASTSTGTTSNAWLEWDVTSDVQTMVLGQYTNYGWRIKDSTEGSTTDYQASFRSREYTTDTTKRPQLVVNVAIFPASPDSGFTHTNADTVGTHSFFLDPATVSYINGAGVRKATMLIRSTSGPTYTLSTDQVLFIASP